MSKAPYRTLEALSAHNQRHGPEAHTRPEGVTGCGPRGGGLEARVESEPHAYHTHERFYTLPSDIQQTPCHEQGMPGVCTSFAQNMTLLVIQTAHRATDGRVIKPSTTQADWHTCTSTSYQGIRRSSVAGGSKSVTGLLWVNLQQNHSRSCGAICWPTNGCGLQPALCDVYLSGNVSV